MKKLFLIFVLGTLFSGSALAMSCDNERVVEIAEEMIAERYNNDQGSDNRWNEDYRPVISLKAIKEVKKNVCKMKFYIKLELREGFEGDVEYMKKGAPYCYATIFVDTRHTYTNYYDTKIRCIDDK